MTDRSIASRPTLEQVIAIVDFMEGQPALAQGIMRGLEGREASKKLWMQITRMVNNIPGPTRPMKSWIKFWADKKSTVRAKVQASGGDPNVLCSNIEKRIWDLFLDMESFPSKPKRRASVKQETTYVEDTFINEDSMERLPEQEPEEDMDSVPLVAFKTPANAEERQVAIMEKLAQVMSDQAVAMAQMAQAAMSNSQAMERLADASHIQARALERLAAALAGAGAGAGAAGGALRDIDLSFKRLYAAEPS